MKTVQYRKTMSFIFAFILVTGLFCKTAVGATTRPDIPNELIDTTRICSLTLSWRTNDTEIILPQTTFQIYKVATVDIGCKFIIEEPFVGNAVWDNFPDINSRDINMNWASLAEALSNATVADPVTFVPIATHETNAEGYACFSDLRSGLYLVCGATVQSGANRYTPIPTLVSLPVAGKDHWVYDGSGNMKYKINSLVPDTTTTRKVLFVWNDDGYEDMRPATVSVDLCRNGMLYRNVSLSAGNNWRYTWENLSAQDTWTITTPDLGDDYTVSIEQSGITFVITYTYLGDIEDPDAPPDPDDPDVPLSLMSLRNTNKLLIAERQTQTGSQLFQFDITISEKTGTYPIITPPGDVIGYIQNGTGTFQLEENQTFSVIGLPDGVTYTIKEHEQEGWTTLKLLGNNGTAAQNQSQIVTVVNQKEEVQPSPLPEALPATGGPGEDILTFSGILLIWLGVCVYRRKKFNSEGTDAT